MRSILNHAAIRGLLVGALAIGLATTGAALEADAQTERLAAIRADSSLQIKGLMERQGLASVAVVAFTGHNILWVDAFGYANVASAVPASPDTVYNTGSTFKIVMVMAIMQLVEAGKLDLDVAVNRYLKDPIEEHSFEDTPLTLRHMLAHHSGLPASRPVPSWDLWSRQSPPPIQEQISGLKMVAPPGTVYEYCNTCFMVYAELIESTSGMTLARFLREHILIPSGSRYTEPLYPDASMVEHLALPYEQVGRTPFPMPQKFLTSWMSGDTYLRPLDMAQLLQVFLSDGRIGDVRLLSAETVRSMMPAQFRDISLGFVSETQNDRRVLWWDGGIYGGSTVYQLEPDAGFGVYLAANANAMTDALHMLARRIRDLWVGVEMPFDPEFDFAPEVQIRNLSRAQLATYTGAFQIAGTEARIHVDILNDHLALTNPSGERYDLVMTSLDSGLLIGPRERVDFEREPGGDIHRLRIGGPEGAVADHIDGRPIELDPEFP